MKVRLISIIILFVCSLSLNAKRINISFSKFPFTKYSFVLYRGSVTDTIAKGRLDTNGSVEIEIPTRYKNYRGIGTLFLQDGSKIDMVVTKEDFSLTSALEKIDLVNLNFSGSEENDYLVKGYREFNALNHKLKQLKETENLYHTGDIFYSQIETELKRLNDIGIEFKEKLHKSKFYAARFLEFTIDNDNLGVYYTKKPEEIRQMQSYIRDRLVFTDLYTSSLWKPIIENWFALEHSSLSNESDFFPEAVGVMKRIQTEAILDEFANNMVDLCEQYEWEVAKARVLTAIYNSQRLPNPTRHLAILIKSYGVQIGGVPPDFEIRNGLKLSDCFSNQILLFFYESDCSHCQQEVKVLKKNYDELTKKGIRIISVSSDMDKATFDNFSNTFPWKDRVQDAANKLFPQYGIIATPTLFVISKEGRIEGRYATLKSSKL